MSLALLRLSHAFTIAPPVSPFPTLPTPAQGASQMIRVGAFPYLTHVQAMIGQANGRFDKQEQACCC